MYDMLTSLFVVYLMVGTSHSYGVGPRKDTKVSPNSESNVTTFIKKLKSTEVICQASKASICPIVMGGTEWEPVPGNSSSGSRWISIMGESKVFCKSITKRDCPIIPGDEGWVMIPPEVKMFCETRNDLSCRIPAERTWHSLPPVSAVDNQKVHTTTASPKQVHLETRRLPKSTKTPTNSPEHTPKILYAVVGKSKIYCAPKGTDCPKIEKTAEWTPTNSTIYAPTFQILQGETRIMCTAQNASDCPLLSKSSLWQTLPAIRLKGTGPRNRERKDVTTTKRPEENVGKDGKKIFVTHVEKTKMYCASHDLKKCPRVEGGDGKWSLTSNVEPAKFEFFLAGAKLYCVENEVDLCPMPTKLSLWQPVESEASPKTNNSHDKITFMTTVRKTPIYCEAKLEEDCPIKAGVVGSWKPNPGPTKEFRFELLFAGVPLYCAEEKFSQCPMVLRTAQWQPTSKRKNTNNGNSNVKKKMYKTTYNNMKLYCKARFERECQTAVDVSNWVLNDEPIKHPKFEMTLPGISLYCMAFRMTLCPRIRTHHWNPTDDNSIIPANDNSDDDVQNQNEIIPSTTSKAVEIYELNSSTSHASTSHASTSQARTSHARNEIKISMTEAGNHSPTQDGKSNILWMIVNGLTGVYCDAVDLKFCPIIRGGGGWKRVKTDDHSQNFEWYLKSGNTTVYCDANYVAKCPKVRYGESWMKYDKTQAEVTGQPNISEAVLILAIEKSNASDERAKKDMMRYSFITGAVDRNTDYDMAAFVVRTGRVNVFCFSVKIEDCRVAELGNWKSSNEMEIMVLTKRSKWSLVVGNATFFCENPRKESCPAIRKNRNWLYVGPMWNRLVRRFGKVIMYCDTKMISTSCPRIQATDEWRFLMPLPAGAAPPKGSRYAASNRTTKFYCSSELDQCKKIWPSEWERISPILSPRAFCDTWDVELCPAIGEEGVWVPLKKITKNEAQPPGTKWTMKVNESKFHCLSDKITSCPHILGDKLWMEASSTSHPYEST